MYSKEQIEKAVKSQGFVWFNGSKDYDVNIVGVRNSTPGQKVTNLFDDKLTLSYKVGGEWFFHEWEATTEPGKKGVMQFHNSGGVARLVPNQYRGAYALGMHQGKYQALCQRKEVTVWRDKNRDMDYDEIIRDTGIFGINIHKAGTVSNFVENWSEGCQVFKRTKDFNDFMVIINRAKEIHGNHFTYTLIISSDING